MLNSFILYEHKVQNSVLSAASFGGGFCLRQAESLRESRGESLQEVSLAELRLGLRLQRAVLARLQTGLPGMESVARRSVACESGAG